MATNVTVLETYANPDYFEEKNSPVYIYGGKPATPASTLSWVGNTANGIGTYGSATSIVSEEFLRWDEDNLLIGDVEVIGDITYEIVVGSTTLGEDGALHLIGNKTSNGIVGEISFRNEASAHADNIISEYVVSRNGDDDAGLITVNLADSSASLNLAYSISELYHLWGIGSSSTMWLTGSALYPHGVGGLDLGLSGTPWGAAYLQSVRVTGLAGTGDRMLYADTSGNVTASTLTETTLLASLPDWGSVDQIPHMNSAGDNFDYSSDFTFENSTLTIGGSGTTSQINLDNTSTYNWWIQADGSTDMTFGYYTSTYFTIDSSGIMLSGTINFSDTNTQIWEDVSGNLTFKDAISGTQTLADLLSGGSGVSFGADNQIPYTNSTTDDFDYTTNFQFDGTDFTVPGGILAPSLTSGTTGDYLLTWDTVTGEIIYDSGISVTNDGIQINTIGGRLAFGDGDTYMREFSDDELYFYVGGIQNLALYSTVVSSNVDFTPTGNKTLDLGGSAVFWDNLYIDRVYVDNTSTYIDISGNDMTFTDAASGTVTLASLVAGAPSYGADNQIPYTNSTTSDFDYTTGFSFDGTDFSVPGGLFAPSLTEGITGDYIVTWDTVTGEIIYDNDILITGSPSGVRLGGTGAQFSFGTGTEYIDVSGGDMRFTDGNSGTVTLASLVSGGSSPWTKSGTNISPTTSGDDILLAVSTERITFGDGDTYIYEDTDDHLYFYTGASFAMYINTTDMVTTRTFRANGNKAQNLGSTSVFWNEAFVDRLYIGDTDTYLYHSVSTLHFVADSSSRFQINPSSIYVYEDLLPQTTTKTVDLGSATKYWRDFYIDDIYQSGAHYEPTVSYTAIGTNTPAAGTKFINVSILGATGTIYVDLDNLEYASYGAVVYVSSYLAAATSLTLTIRNGNNNILRTVTTTGSSEDSWMFVWDPENDRWNSVALTEH